MIEYPTRRCSGRRRRRRTPILLLHRSDWRRRIGYSFKANLVFTTAALEMRIGIPLRDPSPTGGPVRLPGSRGMELIVLVPNIIGSLRAHPEQIFSKNPTEMTLQVTVLFTMSNICNTYWPNRSASSWSRRARFALRGLSLDSPSLITASARASSSVIPATTGS